MARRSKVVATREGTRAFELRSEIMYERAYKSDNTIPRAAARLIRWRANASRTDRWREQVMGRRARELLRRERLFQVKVNWLVSDDMKKTVCLICA